MWKLKVVPPDESIPLLYGGSHGSWALKQLTTRDDWADGDVLGGAGTSWNVVVPGYGIVMLDDIGAAPAGAPGSWMVLLNREAIWYYNKGGRLELTVTKDGEISCAPGAWHDPVTSQFSYARPKVAVLLGGGLIDPPLEPNGKATFRCDVVNVHPFLRIDSLRFGVDYDRELFTKSGITITDPLGNSKMPEVSVTGVAPARSASVDVHLSASVQATDGSYSFSLDVLDGTFSVPPGTLATTIAIDSLHPFSVTD
jgi:hypothetical protein